MLFKKLRTICNAFPSISSSYVCAHDLERMVREKESQSSVSPFVQSSWCQTDYNCCLEPDKRSLCDTAGTENGKR